MDFDFKGEAKKLKAMFPKATEGWTEEEVLKVWRDYSDSLAAHWLIFEGILEERMASVFARYKLIEGKIYKEL